MLQVEHKNLEPVWIIECAFMDYLVLFTNSEKKLRKNITWDKALTAKNLMMDKRK